MATSAHCRRMGFHMHVCTRMGYHMLYEDGFLHKVMFGDGFSHEPSKTVQGGFSHGMYVEGPSHSTRTGLAQVEDEFSEKVGGWVVHAGRPPHPISGPPESIPMVSDHFDF